MRPKRTATKIAALLIFVSVIFTAFHLPMWADGAQVQTYSKEYNSGTRGEICASLDGTSAYSYYTGSYSFDTLITLSSSVLKSSLHSLMTDTHSKVSSYDDCHYKADVTDCENGNGKVTLLYTSYQATMEQWNGWNREHVWPQSLGGGNTTGGGADLHHVRPSDAGVNSSRGNKKYGESGNSPNEKYGSNPAVGVLGGTYNSNYFEPLDNVKGDVARICLYVYVRWGEDWGADSITDVFQSVDVLLEWCELDPVDTWEMGRNEVVQNIQGNRNVFIDYPELAWLLYEKEVPEGMITPSLSALDGELPTPPQGGGEGGNEGGEGGNEGGEGGNEGGEGVEIPDAPVPEFPETERPFYNNIYYGDTLKFMFASPESPSVSYFDGENNYTQLKIKPFVENGKQLTVYGYPVWISEQGMPLQNIGKRITVTVGELTETYSVLEYVYTRLYVSTNTTPAEKHMYNTLIDYAKKADVVLNGVKESDIGTEYLVRVTNGTVDGATASDLYKIGETPLGNIAPEAELSDCENLAWEVRETVDGVTSTKIYTDEEIRDLQIKGHTVITAIDLGEEDEPTEPVWRLVTDVSQLSVGDRIIIAARDHSFAMSTTQNGNNRGQTAIEREDDRLAAPSQAVQIITLESGAVSGTFAFNIDGTGYLYAASSSNNYLRTKATLDANGSWSITVNSDGTAVIKSQGSYSRNLIKYNKTSSLFSCYAEGSQQLDVAIYVLTE